MKINYIVISFLIGSIPFAVLLTKIWCRRSIQVLGDKNPGARNVVHSVGFLPGLLTLLLDAGKGFVLMFILHKTDSSTAQVLVYLFIGMLGHAFSPFLLGTGGQGVAMLIGAMVWLFPVPAFLSTIVFGILRQWVKSFDLRYSLVLALFCIGVFLCYPLLWKDRLLLVGLFLFPLVKGFLFPKD
jgi:acyl phosphate:glycerol-3-phosphate acyltransferase